MTAQTRNGSESVVRVRPAVAQQAARQRARYRRWAIGLILIGLTLLAFNFNLLPAGLITQVAAFWPGLLILLGLLIVAGRFSLNFPLPSFAIERGDYQAGQLHLSAGLGDVHLSSFAGTSQLAVGRFPGYGEPRLGEDGSEARVVLDQRAVSPLLFGPWTVALAKGLPWSLALHSELGQFHLHLRDLNVTSLWLHAGAGDVDLSLPAMGQGEMTLSLLLGDLTLRVPEGMAVKIKLAASPLVHVELDKERFVQTGPCEWVTPNFSAFPHRFTLSITLRAGDLIVA